MLNPDGVTLSQRGLNFINDQALKSKLLAMNNGNYDFSRWKANINGVDLNRNFNAGWYSITHPLKPSPLNYKGPKPESEPESRAIANYTRYFSFDATISYHATGSIIYWYYYQGGARLARDKKLLEGLINVTGYKPVLPKKRLTSHAGYGDWFILGFQKPNFTIEIGKSGSKCPLKIEEFPDIWNRNKYTSVYLADRI